MRAVNFEKLTARFVEVYGVRTDVAEKAAKNIIQRCPAALQKNLIEWQDNQPLTDIYIDRYSLPMILSIWGSRDFLRAFDVMVELAKGHIESAEFKIWTGKR